MTGYVPPMTRLEIVHADASMVAVNKPSGLLSVPGRGEDKADCALSRVQGEFPDALTVHRLDMATSGLLLFARSKAAQRALSSLFARGEVNKRYIAEVWGVPVPAAGEISLPLITDWPRRPLQKVDWEIGKPSVTRYETLAATGRTARIALTPLTGRSHQLRVHLAEIHNPILGDEFYAHADALAAAPRLALHAASLGFVHPETGVPVRLESPVPF
ncbi:MAG: RNA pseudouridine synthase [Hyphomonas sp.]|uniref:pseudouridine synthase n=1 Tax=Hyphomonas sp. TaxID=87 RepID=UPI00183D6227|nr:pseudouridine synthase [Hyphomonas sp.]MBU3919581.1 RNA pseudouridine synthase [Alphaproteobacteria bacterium]MBA3068414.1 RNA pseudouridine synthase [Hyphomonas sp.]MBU4060718.1 RNA pseudouridine synthase [Alphaproteobacteria bacterium]MBU4164702.1 RNA pseudouridine synthase [Alphaproteobacteria bacterium]MBU4569572.1 RNA pseudouridine synthase [Alphaproteobacteria bacterium]